MRFFNRKTEENSPQKHNEMQNKELKEYLANQAAGSLMENNEIEQFDHTTVEFGYLFDFEGHGLEGLFQVTTDKTTAYFAAQGTRLSRVELSEEAYQATVAHFLELHGACEE